MDIKALREEFAGLHTESTTLVEKAAAEKREFTAEEKEADDKRLARMSQIQTYVDNAKRLAEFSVMNGTAELPVQPKGKAEFDAEATGKVEFDKDSYRAAVNHFARTGDASKAQQFAAAMNFAITSATGSGVYIPKSVVEPVNVRRLPNAIRAVLAHYGLVPITRTLTEGISIPVNDDSANSGQQQDEAATSGTAVDPSASGSLGLLPTLYSSKQQWVSNTTAMAVDFDVFSWVLPMLDRRLDKTQESAWVQKIKTTGTVGKTTASATAVTYAEWLAFEHSLPAAYRTDSAFILSDSAYQAVRGLVDDNNRPILDLDPANNFMATIHGKPVFISDYFDAVAASKVVGAFVSADALKVFDAGLKRIARYILQPAHGDQTGFELFANGDFGFVSAGVRTLATAAAGG